MLLATRVFLGLLVGSVLVVLLHPASFAIVSVGLAAPWQTENRQVVERTLFRSPLPDPLALPDRALWLMQPVSGVTELNRRDAWLLKLEIATSGSEADPENAFWSWHEAIAQSALGNKAQAQEALAKAKERSHWYRYAPEVLTRAFVRSATVPNHDYAAVVHHVWWWRENLPGIEDFPPEQLQELGELIHASAQTQGDITLARLLTRRQLDATVSSPPSLTAQLWLSVLAGSSLLAAGLGLSLFFLGYLLQRSPEARESLRMPWIAGLAILGGLIGYLASRNGLLALLITISFLGYLVYPAKVWSGNPRRFSTQFNVLLGFVAGMMLGSLFVVSFLTLRLSLQYVPVETSPGIVSLWRNTVATFLIVSLVMLLPISQSWAYRQQADSGKVTGLVFTQVGLPLLLAGAMLGVGLTPWSLLETSRLRTETVAFVQNSLHQRQR
ncbi:MAG: hypothetical protein MUC92_02685 [Fimbriimonadaceae bacterium]|jgi:hypothetical protein|nr:hypothetical protein [Fimbriimonadaceae bacterium]